MVSCSISLVSFSPSGRSTDASLFPFTAALPAWGNWHADASSSFARTFAAKSFFGGEAQRSGSSPSLISPSKCQLTAFATAGSPTEILSKLEELALSIDKHKLPYKLPELRDLFYRGAATVIKSAEVRFFCSPQRIES